MPEVAALPAEHPPVLVLVVDTEEEFDWTQPFDRRAVGVTAMTGIGRFQEACDELGAPPCYVVDYPVCDQPEGYTPLLAAARDGRCEIGAHLHPWVNPPFVETLCSENSYPGNLPPEIERAKLESLRLRLEEVFGGAPVTYKAGRYGIGPNTPAILESVGFRIDLSPTPGFTHARDGGPDFITYPVRPHWLPTRQPILCLPTTGGYMGALGLRVGALAHRAGTRAPLSSVPWRGALSRLGLAKLYRLTPEGHDLEDNTRFARYLVRRGVRVLNYSFHSPSLKPGHTRYTRSADDVDRFVESIRGFIEFFQDDLGGVVMTPGEIYRRMAASPAFSSGTGIERGAT